jgi:hypothetical protein
MAPRAPRPAPAARARNPSCIGTLPAAAAVAVLAGLTVTAAPLTPGGFLILRVGGGGATAPAGGALTSVYLDEYDLFATPPVLLQTIPLPDAVSGGARACTLPPGNTATTDMHGHLELTAAGFHVYFACYSQAVGTTAYTANTALRSVGRINAFGDVEMTNAFSPNAGWTPYSATSPDGASRVYLIAGTQTSGMLTILHNGTAATSVTSSTNYRSGMTWRGNLWGFRVGGSPDVQQWNGYPTGNANPASNGFTGNDYSDLRSGAFLSLSELYLVDQGVGLYRLSRAGTTGGFTRSAAFTIAAAGNRFLDIAVQPSNNATAFVTTSDGVYAFRTLAGGTPGWNSATPIVTAPTNAYFRGIAAVPVVPPSPSPTPSPSATPSNTPTPTPTSSNTPTPTPTKSPGASDSPTPTASWTPTPSGTPSRTPTVSNTASNTPTPSTTATAAASVDLGAIARAAGAEAQTALIGGIIGAIVGAVVLIAAVGGGAWFINKQRTSSRLKKLKSSAAAASGAGGPAAYRAAWHADDDPADSGSAAAPTIIYQVNMGGGRGGGNPLSSKAPAATRGALAAYGAPSKGGRGGSAV